jgi:uncharacterized Zn-finger protein
MNLDLNSTFYYPFPYICSSLKSSCISPVDTLNGLCLPCKNEQHRQFKQLHEFLPTDNVATLTQKFSIPNYNIAEPQASSARHQIINSDESNERPLMLLNLTCSLCDAVFQDISHLSRHISIVHYKNRSYQCSHCSVSFGRKSNLKKHFQTHERRKDFACPADNCNTKFCNKKSLQRHQRKFGHYIV